ncbi:hypothetical protein [Tsuneonella mangrovi]|uniref:hypothetical protein n=1 Tax=Tsuneonella mangrovi TaxID=1982042 RepID=UPI0014713066|nr:hypothetical protein [Tsuneonella mangrovi]
MLADTDHRPVRLHAAPRGPGARLRAAIADLAEQVAQITHHREKPWASVTFEGARHNLALVFEGAEAVAAGERFIAALPEHEFAIPGQLVADASVTEVDHTLAPSPRLVVTCELLLLKDA